ncbi:hypothetical protein F4604DRAFT_1912844 [Suillus subluteus]|nr:hypothetical protein F4604DRAFT_1912844 [Suillus subluteus]
MEHGTRKLLVESVVAKGHDPHTSPKSFCDLNTIYEFDALTLEIVGAPFEDASRHTIKLWAFESRQLLASFDQLVDLLIFSHKSHQLGIRPAQEAQPTTTKNPDLLDSDATPRTARRRKRAIVPVISHVPRPVMPPPTMHSRYLAFLRYLRELLPFPARAQFLLFGMITLFPATSPLPPNRSPSAQATTQTHSHTNFRENPRLTPAPPTTLSSATASKARLSRLFTQWPVHTSHVLPSIVDVPLAQAKLMLDLATVVTNDGDEGSSSGIAHTSATHPTANHRKADNTYINNGVPSRISDASRDTKRFALRS